MKKLIALLCAVVVAASALVGVTSVRSSNKIKALNTELAALQETADSASQQAEALSADVAAKTAEIEALTADAAEKATRIEALTAELDGKKAEIEQLTADAAAKAEENAVQAAEAQAQIESLTADAAEKAAQIEALTAEAAEKDAQIESLTQEVAQAQQTLQAISDTLSRTAPSQEAAPAAALPAVGDVVNGFETVEIREFPLVGATAVLFEHQKTGAKLMYIANEVTNRVFDLTFLTRPTDNTGLPHVFEHSTLSGSEKFPSAALFMNLSYQTYNTYMNAFTMDAMTSYPIASLSEAQLLKYADFYTDSCLHPMILQDESIFRTEAWRYRMAGMEDDLTLEGTVYSEMQGALNLNGMALLNANRAAFPGSVLGYEYGGDPDYIPDMTWESLKEYHSLFYHPSNCIAYLYGQFEDYAAFLALLDEAFAPYEKAEFHFEDSAYTPITGPVVEKVGFPMAEGTNPENQSVIYYYILCPGLRDDPARELVVDNLCSLLSADASVLMQTLKKALPTGTFGAGREVAAPDDAVVFVAANVNENDAELFRQTVESSLRQVAEEGFPQDMLDSVTATLALNQKLIAENSDIGVDLIRNIAYTYATSGNPFGYFEGVESLDHFDEWNQQGLFASAVSDWLLDKELTALVTTYPEPGQKEVKDAALAARLAEIKAGMTEEEKQAIVDASNADLPEEDASALVARLQAVTVQSLPEEMKQYAVSDETGDNGIRRIDVTAGVDGVGRANMYLDASGLAQEDIHWAKLLSDLIGQLDTDSHTKEELDVLRARYLYNGGINLTAFEVDDQVKPVFRMGWTSLDEDLPAAYDLVYELVYGTQFTDTQKLLEQVQAIKASLRSSLNSTPYTLTLYRSLAVSSPYYRFVSYANYLDYYQFLEGVEAALADAPEAVAERLAAVQQALNNSTNAILTYVGNEESIALNRPLADAFANRLAQNPVTPAAWDLPVPASREAVIVDGSVQYNGLIADFDTLGLTDYDAGLEVLATLVSDAYLIPQLRDQYGVYTPWAGSLEDGGLYLLTYRDPNVAQTYAVYESLADQIAALDIDQETLDGYILSVYSGLAKSQGELSGGLNAMTAAITGDPQDKALTYMRQLKAVTPETVHASAEIFRKLAENGVRITTGSAAAINANAELYDAILNPFNAQDTSKVVFTDLAEDSPYYEAVRFMFGEGLMAPRAEDAFGVDEDATMGDFAVPLYMMYGGNSSQEEAVQFLVSNNLATPDTRVDEPMPKADLLQIMQMLAGGAELQLPERDGETATRGELALLYYQVLAN